MKNIVFAALFFVASIPTFAQHKNDYNWVNGYICVPFFDSMPANLYHNFILGFNSDTVSLTHILNGSPMDVVGASMSNEAGVFMYHSNGCRITNPDFELMENGDSINYGDGEIWNNHHCTSVTGEVNDIFLGYPFRNTMMSAPFPGRLDTFVMFHISEAWNDADPSSTSNLLHGDNVLYTVIDMTANNGKGKVLAKNQVMLEGSFEGKLKLVKQDGGQGWWIIVSYLTTNEYAVFELTHDGVSGLLFKQGFGPNLTAAGGGGSVFSSQGDVYARSAGLTFGYDSVMVADFDRSTGLFSNAEVFAAPIAITSHGLAFSPSGQYLYLGLGTALYQYDVWSTDIKASETLVATWDGYLHNNFYPEDLKYMHLGPDCRIYVKGNNGGRRFGVINYPDRQGEACMVQQHIIDTECYLGSGMPEFPNYRLDTPFPVCDSTIALTLGQLSTDVQTHIAIDGFAVWPNPFSSQLNLDWGLPSDGLSIALYDVVGRLVVQQDVVDGSERFAVTGLNLPEGVYGLVMRQDNRIIASRSVLLKY